MEAQLNDKEAKDTSIRYAGLFQTKQELFQTKQEGNDVS